ncbi:MAG: type II 3-dehydroquinate dehydratase [Clostridia bacterium]|nr:type II 3-dehydroquinate dehydratase [Clostridia bacterium]
MRILIINGPNINMLGIREPELYGNKTYSDLVNMIGDYCDKRGIDTKFFQSNYEGAIVEEIQNALSNFDGIIINPAAYTHTSVAILDALKAVSIPAVEVHISNVDSREDFRQISFVRKYCFATISGEGFEGYIKAVKLLEERMGESR